MLTNLKQIGCANSPLSSESIIVFQEETCGSVHHIDSNALQNTSKKSKNDLLLREKEGVDISRVSN